MAFGLRIEGLNARNIWLDEGYSQWAARQPIDKMVKWTAHDVHPPLYYVALHDWWRVVSEGEFVLRFLSALFGTLGVALTYGLAKELGGYRAGLLAALTYTLARFTIAQAQEMRMHMLASILVTGGLWAALCFWRTASGRAWFVYVVMMAGGLYTFYLSGVALAITNLVFPVIWWRSGHRRRMLLHWLAAQLVVIGAFWPWLAYTLPRTYGGGTEESFSALFGVKYYLVTLTVGVNLDPEQYLFPTLIALALLAWGTIVIGRATRTIGQTGGRWVLVLGVLLPVPVVFALALPIHPDFARPLTPRYFLPLASCFYALEGWALVALARRRRWWVYVTGGVMITLALVGLATLYPGRMRTDDYLSLAHTLETHYHPSDRVLLHTDRNWPIFSAHYPGDLTGVPFRMGFDAASVDHLLAPLWQSADAIWLITVPDAQRADPTQAVASWLDARATARATWEFGENRLTLYARAPARARSLTDLAPDFAPPSRLRQSLSTGQTLLGVWQPLDRYRTGDTIHLVLYWDQPPQDPLTLDIVGTDHQTLSFDPPTPSSQAVTAQNLAIHLPPSLIGGDYRLRLQIGTNDSLELGDFTLVPSHLPTIVADTSEIKTLVGLRFGESIELVGYDLESPTERRPGDSIRITLYWRADAPIANRYKVSVYLLGQEFNPENGTPLWGQEDNEPANWRAPTTLWHPGDIIADEHRFMISAIAPAGDYALGVLLYGLADGARLPITDAADAPVGDMVTLETIRVGP